jgi:hypothetical protein
MIGEHFGKKGEYRGKKIVIIYTPGTRVSLKKWGSIPHTFLQQKLSK